MLAGGYDLADMDVLRSEPSAVRTQKTLHENGMWVLTLCGAHRQEALITGLERWVTFRRA